MTATSLKPRMLYGLIHRLILSAFISPSASLCDNDDGDDDDEEDEVEEEDVICTNTLPNRRKS